MLVKFFMIKLIKEFENFFYENPQDAGHFLVKNINLGMALIMGLADAGTKNIWHNGLVYVQHLYLILLKD